MALIQFEEGDMNMKQIVAKLRALSQRSLAQQELFDLLEGRQNGGPKRTNMACHVCPTCLVEVNTLGSVCSTCNARLELVVLHHLRQVYA